MSEVLARWNGLPREEAAREILPCCGSENWAASMASKRPIQDELSLMETSDTVWRGLPESDWLEAFRSHPRIGESRAEADSVAQSSAWSEQEQHTSKSSGASLLFARRENQPAKFWRFCGAGCTMMKPRNCNRLPRSSVKSCVFA